MKFKRWELWLARVAYEDQPNVCKKRPVIVYSETECFTLSFKVSSQNPHAYRENYELQMWREAGLDKPSFISLNPVRIKIEDMLFKIGKLHLLDIQKINTLLDNK